MLLYYLIIIIVDLLSARFFGGHMVFGLAEVAAVVVQIVSNLRC